MSIEVPERWYMGIDPGGKGGMAFLDATGKVLFMTKMLDTEAEIWDWVLHCIYSRGSQNCRAVIEQVSGYIPGREDKTHGGQPGSHMFQFGMSYGGLRMALVAADLVEGETFRAVIPRTWQKHFSIEPRRKNAGETQPQFKARLKKVAEERFPELKGIALNTCDALLLAEYARQTDLGEMQ